MYIYIKLVDRGGFSTNLIATTSKYNSGIPVHVRYSYPYIIYTSLVRLSLVTSLNILQYSKKIVDEARSPPLFGKVAIDSFENVITAKTARHATLVSVFGRT